ncbi:uncharacterized protein LOC129944953 [Eupeodes corollae]|uniref:uncharacterized protein LOC129944953 n=1 Tax=Eupeodes corollae TaxID=290404 RepID=UPI002491DBB5|nr:uncharacterized protein LOC129944953 [Eupeodes corollae]
MLHSHIQMQVDLKPLTLLLLSLQLVVLHIVRLPIKKTLLLLLFLSCCCCCWFIFGNIKSITTPDGAKSRKISEAIANFIVMDNKFENMMTTYKRIKKRNKESGREATTWDYFEIFDQAYGGRHSVSPPQQLLCSTTAFPTESNTLSSVVEEAELDGEIISETPTKRKRKNEDELLAFLKKESDKDDLKHQELVTIEREKIEIDKRRLELIKSLQKSLMNLSN